MRDTAAERCRGEARPRRARPHEAPRLHMDDYYARAREFRAWLTARHQYLDELTSTEARRAFREFADAWNAGSLDGTVGGLMQTRITQAQRVAPTRGTAGRGPARRRAPRPTWSAGASAARRAPPRRRGSTSMRRVPRGARRSSRRRRSAPRATAPWPSAASWTTTWPMGCRRTPCSAPTRRSPPRTSCYSPKTR